MNARPSPTAVPASNGSSSGSATLSESSRVICWRLAGLAEAGYPDESAAILATCSDIDLHQAIDLLRRGCPPETALRILL